MVITRDLIPQAQMCGMSLEDAWDATPAEITSTVSAWYKARAVTAWLHGQYVAAAIGVAFSKGAKYPDNPLEAMENAVDPDMELTEEEAEYWRKKLMSNIGRIIPNED